MTVKEEVGRGESLPILIFDDFTGAQFDIDVRGTSDDVRQRYAPAAEPPRGPGRPKLGVVPREVTLLQSHWDWLNAQSGGASVALRKLVHDAMRSSVDKDRARQAIEATYRFLSSMAGNLPNFEEASRALFAEDQVRFGELTAAWPADIREHANKLLTSR
ncbi:hypothetical protein OP10G_0681 [Fimbriimonas ginsengisoli Gsoil 348]|uniref:DUF2239 domain-containing protein n=1 Tax=Fimbriimonas ginsengisoli Gsoil 348 TaxID=661478 RepID=A0A068NR65_FIMGI|nr:hypothetical protein OP10G_0681 [Fimbriimonas ginsengisoli Gsoil 348]